MITRNLSRRTTVECDGILPFSQMDAHPNEIVEGLEHVSGQVQKMNEKVEEIHKMLKEQQEKDSSPEKPQQAHEKEEENKKLREQVQQKDDEIKSLDRKWTTLCERFKKLQTENRELKEELEQKKEDNDLLVKENKQLAREVEKSQEDLNQLHEEPQENHKSVHRSLQAATPYEHVEDFFEARANGSAWPQPPQSSHHRQRQPPVRRVGEPSFSIMHQKQRMHNPNISPEANRYTETVLEKYNEDIVLAPSTDQMPCRNYRKYGKCNSGLCRYSHEDLKRSANDTNNYNSCFCVKNITTGCLHNDDGQCSKNHIGRGLPGDLPNPPVGYQVIISQGRLCLEEAEEILP